MPSSSYQIAFAMSNHHTLKIPAINPPTVQKIVDTTDSLMLNGTQAVMTGMVTR